MKQRLPNLGSRWWALCGATEYYEYRGARTLAVCSRFKGHEEKAKNSPHRHFDELKKHGWES